MAIRMAIFHFSFLIFHCMALRMAATVLGQFVAEPSGWPFFIFHFSFFISLSGFGGFGIAC